MCGRGTPNLPHPQKWPAFSVWSQSKSPDSIGWVSLECTSLWGPSHPLSWCPLSSCYSEVSGWLLALFASLYLLEVIGLVQHNFRLFPDDSRQKSHTKLELTYAFWYLNYYCSLPFKHSWFVPDQTSSGPLLGWSWILLCEWAPGSSGAKG